MYMKKVIILTAMLLTTACGALATTVSTYYIDTTGQKVTTDAILVTGHEKALTGTYLVTNTVISQSFSRPVVAGEVKLILADGAAYIATYGISVGSGQSLTIYAQEKGTGLLNAGAFEYCAAIGGTGGNDADGNLVAGKAGGSVTINGGNVFVKGGTGAAGIGSGRSAPVADNSITLTVNGGYVEATGGDQGAGIGGGYQSNGGKVTINGGRVKATGGSLTAGIGNGYFTFPLSVEKTEFTMTGGEVTAIGSANIGISAQANPTLKNINVSSGADEDVASLKTDWTGSNGDIYTHLIHDTYYIDTVKGEKERVTFTDYTVVTAEQTEWTSGTYLVRETITNPNRIKVTGNVKLVLRDGAKLTASQGLAVEGENNLAVYAQALGIGELEATGNENASGIGGDAADAGGSVSICGGIVAATGGANAPGIQVAAFAISGGTVSAIGTDSLGVVARNDLTVTHMAVLSGATQASATVLLDWDGLNGGAYMYFKPEMYYLTSHNQRFAVLEGDYTLVTDSQTTWSNGTYVVCGRFANTSRITVSGEVKLILADGAKLTGKGITVTDGNKLEIYAQKKGNGALVATADKYYAGIGSYLDGDDSIKAGTMVFHGGIITATGGGGGAGIGGGPVCNGGTVIINGGTITATGGYRGAGIGCGNNYQAEEVGIVLIINGGTVNATGDEQAAGIGGGSTANGGKVTIQGGNVTAQGGKNAPGIGYGAYPSSNPATDFKIKGGTVTAISCPVYDELSDDGIEACEPPVVVNMTLYSGDDEEDAMENIQTDWDGSNGDVYMRLVPTVATPETYYIDTENNNEKVRVSNYVIAVENGVEEGRTIDTEWITGTYVIRGDDCCLPRVTVNGDVKLILEDGARLFVSDGIKVELGHRLTIYGQTEGTGELSAVALNHCAAIGGGSIAAGGGAITICGGKVMAVGDSTVANGIGGGIAGAPVTFAMYGGEVTALGMSAIAAAATPVVKDMLVFSGASKSEAVIFNGWNGSNGGEYMHLKLMGTTTSTTPDAVPHAWLDQYSEVHGQGTGEGTDYEAAAKATGKNGYALWQSYVLGLDPDKEDSRFVVTIEMDENGKPVIDWSPKNVVGRTYTLEGRTSLNDEAGWVEADTSTHHFFRVRVEVE